MSRARSKKRESSLGDRLSGEGLQRGGKAELARKLNGFHEILKDLGQDDRPEGIAETAADLASAPLMAHKDRPSSTAIMPFRSAF
eukprot:11902-Heterococcus_DN1.PRE.1